MRLEIGQIYKYGRNTFFKVISIETHHGERWLNIKTPYKEELIFCPESHFDIGNTRISNKSEMLMEML